MDLARALKTLAVCTGLYAAPIGLAVLIVSAIALMGSL